MLSDLSMVLLADRGSSDVNIGDLLLTAIATDLAEAGRPCIFVERHTSDLVRVLLDGRFEDWFEDELWVL